MLNPGGPSEALILRKLEELTGEVKEVKRELTVEVHELRKLLIGNGGVGLCEQVRLSQNKLEEINKQRLLDLQTLAKQHSDVMSLLAKRWKIITIMGIAVFLLVVWHVANGELSNIQTILKAIASLL